MTDRDENLVLEHVVSQYGGVPECFESNTISVGDASALQNQVQG